MLLGSPDAYYDDPVSAEAQADAVASLPSFGGRVVMLGFGCIGSAVLPLLMDRFGIAADRIAILTACDRGAGQADRAAIARDILPITAANAESILTPRLSPGDVVMNLAVEVSSAAIADICLARGAHYLDTAPEPWRGGYADPRLPYLQRCNYGLRRETRAVAQRHGPAAPSGMVGSGANPGLASLFVKRALLNLAAAHGVMATTEGGGAPQTQRDWAALAHRLGVKAVHITETDTQYRAMPGRDGEATNTWSIAALVGEAYLPSELGFGTHEGTLPPDARYHAPDERGSIYLARPGAANLLRSWMPGIGQYGGCIISHPETLSIAEFLTARDDDGNVLHRPTVLFAYRPCDEARLLVQDALGSDFRMRDAQQEPMIEEVVGGADTLGVLLMGQPGRAYWYGSQLDAVAAKRIAPHNNATTLQVCAGILAGFTWILENPRRGLCEAEAMEVDRALAVARPYLGRLFGSWTRWSPAAKRYLALPSSIDRDDPWRFANFRIT